MKNWLRNKDNSEEQLAKNSNHITEQEACHSTHSISVDRTGVWDWSTVRKFKSKTNCGDFIATTSKKMVRDMQCQEIYPCRMYFQVHPGNKTKRGARLAAMPRKVTPKLVFRWSYFEPGVTFDPSVSLPAQNMLWFCNCLETAAQSSPAITTKVSAVIRKGTETTAHNYANTSTQSTHIPNPACISYVKKKRKGRIREGQGRVSYQACYWRK